MDIPFDWGYSRAVFVLIIAIVLYALLTKIADKLRHWSKDRYLSLFWDAIRFSY